MRIVVTGSIAYDYLMRFPGRFKEHFLVDNLATISLSFLVEDMSRHWGGVAANIAYNLALLGISPQIMGTVGQDFADYRVWLNSAGVDTNAVQVIENVFTSSFFVNTDIENNQIATFYSGAMRYARDYTLAATLKEQPEYVVVSPNDPVAMTQLVDECYTKNIPFMYDPSQQIPRLEGNELRHCIERCHTLIVNEYEWSLISNKTGFSHEDVLKHSKVLIITRGKSGAEIFADGERHMIPIFPVPDDKIADPTGVGDAFRAGILCGMALHWPWDVTGRAAALCSAYVLENVGTQNHRYLPEEFVARYRTVYDDRGILDSLVSAGQVAR